MTGISVVIVVVSEWASTIAFIFKKIGIKGGRVASETVGGRGRTCEAVGITGATGGAVGNCACCLTNHYTPTVVK